MKCNVCNIVYNKQGRVEEKEEAYHCNGLICNVHSPPPSFVPMLAWAWGCESDVFSIGGLNEAQQLRNDLVGYLTWCSVRYWKNWPGALCLVMKIIINYGLMIILFLCWESNLTFVESLEKVCLGISSENGMIFDILSAVKMSWEYIIKFQNQSSFTINSL